MSLAASDDADLCATETLQRWRVFEIIASPGEALPVRGGPCVLKSEKIEERPSQVLQGAS